MTKWGPDSAIAGVSRHDLLSVPAADWPRVARSALCSGTLDHDAAALVADWGRRNLPVIARRRTPTDAPGGHAIGLPLPPSLGKLRVALQIPPGVPWRPHPPVTLEVAQPHAPSAWQATITAVRSIANRLHLVPRVFGALLWESLTGLTYLHARSDLDLLWPNLDAARLPALIESLAAIERDAPLRLDGEILCAAGGVNWRELVGDDDPHRTVLVKSADDVRLLPVQHLFPGI